jgi:CspA family cold shock protein
MTGNREPDLVTATVRQWSSEEGWGVLDSPETPGGCWAHFSVVRSPGYRELAAGQVVRLAWEPAVQDGYDYRATTVVP